MKRQTPSQCEPSSALPRQSSANGSIDMFTLDLLKRWQDEDATNDPEQIRGAERELAEFKRAMNENRTMAGDALLYP